MKLPMEAIFPLVRKEVFFIMIYFSSSLSSYLINDSKFTISGSITPFSLLGFEVGYSVKSEDFVSVP